MAAFLLVAATASASDNAYKFRVLFDTDHFLFGDADGTRWRRLRHGCGKVDCEIQLNATNAIASTPGQYSDEKSERDLGFSRVGDTLKARCLRRAGCSVKLTAEEKTTERSLARGETVDVPQNALVDFKAR
ncbi:MAG: hypothetical protein ACXW29_06650 [Thermoanaerobaculia bacterium]